MRAVGLAPTKSIETPDLQSGAFAAQPRTRENFALVKNTRAGEAVWSAALVRTKINSVVKQQKERAFAASTGKPGPLLQFS